MNRTIRLLLVTFISLSLLSCKSKQLVSEIKGANVPATTEVASQPAPTVAKVSTQPEVTRSESFRLADGETNAAAMTKKYHVQVGAFSNHDNARNLRTKLVNEGNNALVVENENGMLRVIISSFDEYNEARAKIDQIRGTYPDAWVLVQKK